MQHQVQRRWQQQQQQEQQEQQEQQGQQEQQHIHRSSLPIVPSSVMINNVLCFLDPDSISSFGQSCSHCRSVVLDDMTYKLMFSMVHPQLSHVQLAVLPRHFDSWRDAFMRKPRVKFDGMYSLRVSYMKEAVRDMWNNGTPYNLYQLCH